MDVATDFALTGTLIINAGGSLTDASGGSAYELNMTTTAKLILNGGDLSIEDTLSARNTSSIEVKACDTLTTGTLIIQNNATFSVDSCAAMIVNGDLFLENDLTNTVNGYIRVNGDVEARNAASISGDGNLSTSGSITYFNTAAIFGSSTDCATGPCFVGTGFPLPIELLYFREI